MVATHRRVIALWHVQQPFKMKSKVLSMCVVPVKVKCIKLKKEFRTYAMLNCFSQETFINTDLARKLKAETNIKMKTLNGEESEEIEAVCGLKVSKSSGERMWIDFQVTYTMEELRVDDDVPTPEKVEIYGKSCW